MVWPSRVPGMEGITQTVFLPMHFFLRLEVDIASVSVLSNFSSGLWDCWGLSFLFLYLVRIFGSLLGLVPLLLGLAMI